MHTQFTLACTYHSAYTKENTIIIMTKTEDIMKYTKSRAFRVARLTTPVGVLLFSFVLPLISGNFASAADLGQVVVRFDRMQVSTQTTGTICAKPSAANLATQEVDVQVTFPTGYTLGAFGTFSVNTTPSAWPSGGTAWPGITAPTGAGDITGQTVKFGSSDLSSSSTLYCFNWDNSAAIQIKSGASSSNTGTVTTRATGAATIDSSGYSTASVTGDQINVTATVPSTFSFALNANSDALGTLSTSGVVSSPTPRTVTVSTNAKNGWGVWAKDSNTGLTSLTASKTIASRTPGTNSTLSTGEGYNTGVTSSQVGGSGTITVAAPFVGTATGQGGGLDTSFRSLATSNGTADTAVLTLKNNVTISATTPGASDYTDTITVVGAGLF